MVGSGILLSVLILPERWVTRLVDDGVDHQRINDDFCCPSTVNLRACSRKQADSTFTWKKHIIPWQDFYMAGQCFLLSRQAQLPAVAMALPSLQVYWFPGYPKHYLDTGRVFKFRACAACAIGSIVILTWINTKGIQEGKKYRNIFTSGRLYS